MRLRQGPRVRSRSLVRHTLWRVAIRIGIVVAIASILSYWHVRSALEKQALNQLALYVEERRARESEVFLLAGDQLRIFVARYRAAYGHSRTEIDAASVAMRFDALFQRREDGTWRAREDALTAQNITGYIGRYAVLDDDLKRRLVVAFDLLAQFGPAWRNRFANLYIVTPEHAVLMYWPGRRWALDAADWEIHGKLAMAFPATDGVVVIPSEVPPETQPQPGSKTDTENETESHWSSLYYDYGADDWLVSATEAAGLDGRRLLVVGHDILLKQLLQRTLTGGIDGTYTLILSESGELIAHPGLMDAIQANGGSLSVAATGDAHLHRIFEHARLAGRGQTIAANQTDNEYLAVTRLEGPGWLLVTVFPHAIIAEQALATARMVLLLGACALLLEIAILYAVLTKQVAQPLRRLVEATRAIASGRSHEAGPTERTDELGELARSFDAMARQVESRERTLSERSAMLARLNERLATELRERHEMEATMARQQEALHQSEKIKALGSLLAGIAHELNNPLSVVVGRAVLLEEKLRDTPQGAGALKLRSAAERCAKIIKTFLAMARQQAPVRQPVDLAEAIDSALDLIASRLRSTGIATHVDMPADLPRVLGDAGQLGQVFGNLLVNAQQALSEHAGERTLTVRGRRDPDGHSVSVTVADTGPGIPLDIRHRIFEPFFTTKPPGVGTGMGLSVCYRIVEVHGGTMRLDSSPGGGAAFVIRLPIAPVPQE